MSPPELVETALDHPIGSPRLEALATGKKNIVIISSDHTRPVPSKIITPILLRRLRAAQPDATIKILVATGFHRQPLRLLPAGATVAGWDTFLPLDRRALFTAHDKAELSGWPKKFGSPALCVVVVHMAACYLLFFT